MAVQLKPLTVFVQDVLEHTFFKARHMATIHYENGKYHLHNELKEIADEDGGITKEKAPSCQKSNENISNQIVYELNFDLTTNSILVPRIIHPDQDEVQGHSQIYFPPPKSA